MIQSQPMYDITQSSYIQKPSVLSTQSSISSVRTSGNSYRHQGELVDAVPRTRITKPKISKTKTTLIQERRPSSFDPFLDKTNQRKFITAGKALMLAYLTKMIAERIVNANRADKKKSRKEKKGLIKKLAKTYFVIQSAKKLLALVEADPNLHAHYSLMKVRAKETILQRASDLMVTPRVQTLGSGTGVKDKALRLAKGLIVREINKHLLKSRVTMAQPGQIPISTSMMEQTIIQTGPGLIQQPVITSHVSKSTVAKDVI